VPIFGIQLSDWLHHKAHDGAVNGIETQQAAFSVNNFTREPVDAAPQRIRHYDPTVTFHT
jgi:hypothetical protein